MLVCLDDHLEHITGISAVLIDELISDGEDGGESGGGDAVELLTLVGVALEAVDATQRQQTLDTGKDRLDIIRVQKLEGDIHVRGPALREVVVQDLSNQGEELLADGGRGGRKSGHKALAQDGLLLLGDRGDRGPFLVVFPRALHLVLEVDDGWHWV